MWLDYLERPSGVDGITNLFTHMLTCISKLWRHVPGFTSKDGMKVDGILLRDEWTSSTKRMIADTASWPPSPLPPVPSNPLPFAENPILLTHFKLECPHFLFLLFHGRIHFHRNPCQSVWWFLPQVQVQSIQLIHSCSWIHPPFHFIREPFRRASEREREREILPDVLEQSAESAGFSVLWVLWPNFRATEISIESGVVLGSRGLVQVAWFWAVIWLGLSWAEFGKQSF